MATMHVKSSDVKICEVQEISPPSCCMLSKRTLTMPQMTLVEQSAQRRARSDS